MPTFNRKHAPPTAEQQQRTPHKFPVRAASVNETERSFEAVVASETPAMILDYRTGDVIEEILVASGGIFPDSVPLQDGHRRERTSDLLGSMRHFRQQSSEWLGKGFMANGAPEADSAWRKIVDGHLNSVSIGYAPLEWVDVPPGKSTTIGGRRFTAKQNRGLRVTTKWSVHEVSVVSIPADPTAKIRSFA